MTIEEARARARAAWGDRAYASDALGFCDVGITRPHYSGSGNEYVSRGSGETWEEAFERASIEDATRKESIARMTARVRAKEPVRREGTTIRKTFGGIDHVIEVVEGGFLYLGVLYKSGFAVTQAINPKCRDPRGFLGLGGQGK